MFEDQGIRQEEFRQYNLSQEECPDAFDYLFCRAERHFQDLVLEGSAIELGERAYYVSQSVYGRAIIARLDADEGYLEVIGDSESLGKIKSKLENLFGEKIKAANVVKAKEGVAGMDISQ